MAFPFQRGDLIEIISMNPSGLWKGKCATRVGNFKFINVEILPEKPSSNVFTVNDNNSVAGGGGAGGTSSSRHSARRRRGRTRGRATMGAIERPKTVEELLTRIGLEESPLIA